MVRRGPDPRALQRYSLARLVNDRDAWQWLQASVASTAIVGTKCDKLPRGQRIRATRELESVFEQSVLPVSAVTGEGLDELWKLIDRLWNNSPAPNPPSSPRPPSPRLSGRHNPPRLHRKTRWWPR